MELSLRKGVFFIIGFIVLIVLWLIFFGGLQKLNGIWGQIFGENIQEDDGSGPRGVCPEELKKELIVLGDIYKRAKTMKEDRCLIPYSKLPDLGDYKIRFFQTTVGTSIGVALGDAEPGIGCMYDDVDGNDRQIIEGVYSCVIGSVYEESWEIFKKNWFYNHPNILKNEIYADGVTILKDNHYSTSDKSDTIEDDLSSYFLYKTKQDGKVYVCLIHDDDNEDNDFTRHIPDCSMGESGTPYGPKQTYACTVQVDVDHKLDTKDKNKITYYFQSGEYYCADDGNPDHIYFCNGDKGKFEKTNPAETNSKTLDSCNGDGRPYNTFDQCCCLTQNPDGTAAPTSGPTPVTTPVPVPVPTPGPTPTPTPVPTPGPTSGPTPGQTPGRDEQCVRFSFPEGEDTEKSCDAFGTNWKQQSCPRNIGFRAGYVP